MGDNIFLYGTLRHPDLLAVVAGTDRLACTPATLPGYAVARAPGGAYPLIAPDPGADAKGLLLCDLTAQARARLDYYELAFGYRLAKVSVRTAKGVQPALAYFPPESAQNGVGPWDLAAWVAEEGALAVQAALFLSKELQPIHFWVLTVFNWACLFALPYAIHEAYR